MVIQRRKQVEEAVLFGREFCFTFAQKTIDFDDRLIIFGFGCDFFHGNYPRPQPRTKSCLLDAKETRPDVTIGQDTRQSHFRTAATILADIL
jgi:hypothetical protein